MRHWSYYRTRFRGSPEVMLSDFGVAGPPVPLQAMLRSMGIRVISHEFDGYVCVAEDSNPLATVGAHAELCSSDRRFALAHALCRLMRDGAHPEVWVRSVHTDDAPTRAANVYAADLLVPRWMIGPALSIDRITLADRFRVPGHLIDYRVRDMT